jgi:TonB family protein
MLGQLLETKQATQRKPVGTFASVVLHVLVIGVAVQLTQKAATALEPPPHVIVRLPLKPSDPTPVKPKPAPTDAASAPVKAGHLELTPPTTTTIDIPAPDLAAVGTDPRDWTGEGPSGGRGNGVPGGAETSANDAPFLDFQVDKTAASIPGTPPSYPEMLKSSGVEGEALVQFVVDTLGRAESGSFKVLRASHDAFGESVRVAMPRMRFLPAESSGRKVRMVVQQRFAFALNR